MVRPLRLEYPGALYHVTSRGNRREQIYADDEDRGAFLDVLVSVVQRFGWECHAYCLMANHYHLLIETPQPNLSRGMRQLNGVYTQRFNQRHRSVGHVFQGRYKAVLVEKEAHLLEVCRYVVLNPVRAGMVSHPSQWRWSSYRATAGLRKPPMFLTTDWVLAQFGHRRASAAKAYRQFVREGVGGESPWPVLRGGFPLGSEEFAAACLGILQDDTALEEMPAYERFAARPALEVLFSGISPGDKDERNSRISQAFLKWGYRQREIGQHVGLSYVTVSRIVQREEEKTLKVKT